MARLPVDFPVHRIIEEWKDGGHPFKSVAEFIHERYGKDKPITEHYSVTKIHVADTHHDTTTKRIMWDEQHGPILKRDVFETQDDDDEEDEYWTEEIAPDQTFNRVSVSFFVKDFDDDTKEQVQEYLESLERE